ncbi:hypothetical protein [Paraclostridium sordellii]|nr:hypothetical protein [Paeniclostridium sordellii]
MLLLTHYSPILKDPSIYIENATNIFENTILGTDRLNINLAFKE